MSAPIRLLLVCCLAIAVASAEAQRRPRRDPVEEDPVAVMLRRPPATGVVVVEVEPDGPAARANLAPGDLIAFYNEREITSLDSLADAIRNAQNLAEVRAVVYRGRTAHETRIATGPIGIVGRAVEKGRGIEVFHKPTPVTLDYSLLGASNDEWREVFIGRQKIGYSHTTLRREGEQLQVTTRLRTLAGGRVTERVASATFRTGPMLELLAAVVQHDGRTVTTGERRGEEWVGKTEAGEVRLKLAGTTLPFLALPVLARMLPQRRGVAIPLTILDELEFRPVRGCELYCAGEDLLALPSGTIRSWRFEQYHYGQLGYTFWVDRDRRVVRAHYGGPTDQLCTTREQALAGLPAEFAVAPP